MTSKTALTPTDCRHQLGILQSSPEDGYSKIGVITSTGHHACWPACQEHHLLASGLRLVLQRQKTDGSTAAAEKEQTLVIQDGWEAELENDKLVLIILFFSISLS